MPIAKTGNKRMGKVNRYPKSIGLGNSFQDFLWEEKRTINCFTILYIYLRTGTKTFPKWSINKCVLEGVVCMREIQEYFEWDWTSVFGIFLLFLVSYAFGKGTCS